MHHRWTRGLTGVLVALGLAVTALGTSDPGRAAGARSGRPNPVTRPCGTRTYDPAHPPAYRHVVVVMDENTSPHDLSPATTPYLTWLRHRCGSEAHMHAATHPSDANYLAATSGLPTRAGSLNDADNVFAQAHEAGDSWRSYQQSMTVACGGHAPRFTTYHDPAHWYRVLRSPIDTCGRYDVPMGPALRHDLGGSHMPTLAWVTPDLCHDMHGSDDCSPTTRAATVTGDEWLSSFVPRILRSRGYRLGRTLLVITWDEGSGHERNGVDCTSPEVFTAQPSCRIPTFVVSPYVVPGARDTADHDTYGLLATVEDVLGYPRLGRAVGRSSLRAGLRF